MLIENLLWAQAAVAIGIVTRARENNVEPPLIIPDSDRYRSVRVIAFSTLAKFIHSHGVAKYELWSTICCRAATTHS